VTLFADQIEFHRMPSTRSIHYRDLFAHLEHFLRHPTRRKTTRLIDTLRVINTQLPKRAMIIVFSDAFLPRENTDLFLDVFKYLHSRHHDVIFFHTLAYSEEVEFALDSPYLRLEDLETGESLHISPTEVREEVQQYMKSWMHRLKVELLQFGVDYIPVDIRQSITQVLLPFLQRRSRRIG